MSEVPSSLCCLFQDVVTHIIDITFNHTIVLSSSLISLVWHDTFPFWPQDPEIIYQCQEPQNQQGGWVILGSMVSNRWWYIPDESPQYSSLHHPTESISEEAVTCPTDHYNKHSHVISTKKAVPPAVATFSTPSLFRYAVMPTWNALHKSQLQHINQWTMCTWTHPQMLLVSSPIKFHLSRNPWRQQSEVDATSKSLTSPWQHSCYGTCACMCDGKAYMLCVSIKCTRECLACE